jgi:hypothetical protein
VRRRSVLWPLAAIVLLGAALRLYDLGARSFWVDEAGTVTHMRLGFGDMLQAVVDREGSPPLYFVLAWFWTQIAGTSEGGLRSFSVLAGVATIPVAYAAGTHVADRHTGLVVALLAAVSPQLVWHAQDGRVYALLVLLAALSFLGFLRAAKQPSRGGLTLWAAASALALCTHYFAVFLVAPTAVWLLVRRRRPATGAAVGAVGATGLALVPLGLSQRDEGSFIAKLPFLNRIVQAAAEPLVGYQPPAEITLSIVAGSLAAVAIARLWRRPDRGRFALSGAFAGLALGLPLLLALLGFDYFYTRNLTAAWLPLAIVLAGGLTGRAGTAVLAGLAGLSVAIVVITADRSKFEHEDWRKAFEALGPAPGGGRAIVLEPPLGRLPLAVYRPATVSLGGAARVQEVAFVLLPPEFRTAGRAPRPPRGDVPAPPGFAAVARREAPTYTLVRFRSPSPVRVTAAELRRLAGSPDQPPSVAVEPGRR